MELRIYEHTVKSHLLLRSANASLSTVMRLVLTGYAMGFNRRHRRSGQLFKTAISRYCARKIIICWGWSAIFT